MPQIICIQCPNGCELTVVGNAVSGHRCARGYQYGLQESHNPVRVLTATMKAEGCEKPFAVKSDKPVPKDMVRKCAAELKNHHPKAPIHIGDVVIENILETGANIVATQDFLVL